MRKKFIQGIALTCAVVLLAGCGKQIDKAVTENVGGSSETTEEAPNNSEAGKKVFEGAVSIELSDEGIRVDGTPASEKTEEAVYIARDIVYYEAGHDFTYGEGTEEDEHQEEEADEHIVVHITEPGTYVLSGQLSAGQIAVDLGEDAEKDHEAVVNLILNGVDIACTVAPAVIFYNVYECGDTDVEKADKDVDTTAAGANVIITDGTVNNIKGSYVARIYKSYELNAAGTEVVSNKKLHKYDGAFYSKMSMNVNGDELGDGVLNITAENEGLDSELHLTINGGNINILSGNDGINTNEDRVSVTTVNGGTLNIQVSGETGEGDGIDSNGWLVINGGTVIAQACSNSADAGIDSDMGIHINGGTVIASGNMLDRISESKQNYAVFSFASRQKGNNSYTLKNAKGEAVVEARADNDFTYLLISDADLTSGTYTLWNGSTQLAAAKGEAMGGFGSMGGFGGKGGFDGMTPPEGMEIPKDMTPPEGMEIPKNMTPPEGMMPPQGKEWTMDDSMDGVNLNEADKIDKGFIKPERTEGQRPGYQDGEKGNWGNPGGSPGGFGGSQNGNVEVTTELEITEGGNYFSNVKAAAGQA